MDETVAKLTVMFEPPFWIELFEREADGKYFVCKYTFGPEPKDYEVYELILSRFCRLQFSPPVRSVRSVRSVRWFVFFVGSSELLLRSISMTWIAISYSPLSRREMI